MYSGLDINKIVNSRINVIFVWRIRWRRYNIDVLRSVYIERDRGFAAFAKEWSK